MLGSAPTYANASWTLASWATANSVGSTEADLRDAFMNRLAGVWGDVYDCRKIYQAAAAAFAPDTTSVPSYDASLFGYIGAVDNRGDIPHFPGPTRRVYIHGKTRHLFLLGA